MRDEYENLREDSEQYKSDNAFLAEQIMTLRGDYEEIQNEYNELRKKYNEASNLLMHSKDDDAQLRNNVRHLEAHIRKEE